MKLAAIVLAGAIANAGCATIVAGGINFFPFKLIVRPEIKTAAELHGKKLAISRFGSASDYAAQLAIEKLGGDPKQVTMLQLGGNPSRLAALTSGTTHATLRSASASDCQTMNALNV